MSNRARRPEDSTNSFADLVPAAIVTDGSGNQFVEARVICTDYESPARLVSDMRENGYAVRLDINDAPQSRARGVSMAGLGDNYSRIFGHENFTGDKVDKSRSN